MALSECPECAFHLTVNPSWQEGSRFDCPDCGALLTVASLSPLQIEKAQD